MKKQAKSKTGSGVVSEATPLPASTQKPYYLDNPNYVYISLKADPDEVVAYLKQYGNNAAMLDLIRELPQMASARPHDTTQTTDGQSATRLHSA